MNLHVPISSQLYIPPLCFSCINLPGVDAVCYPYLILVSMLQGT